MTRLLPLLLLLGCSKPEEPKPRDVDCRPGGESRVLLLSSIRFPREVDGVSAGFDLDGDVSVDGGLGGCGVADVLGPDGEVGIDNALAKIRPALDLTEGAALELIVQEAINSGGLLAMIELSDVDDLEDDACVDLSVQGGLGQPMIGYDGLPLPGQTFDPDPETPASRITDVELAGGRVEGGPVDVSLPFFFLDADIVFHVTEGQVRLEQDAEGNWHGILGGGIPIQALSDLAHNTGIGQEVEDLLDGLLGLIADLNPDESGVCQDISLTLEFDAVQAFWFED